ncbi:hypothetical protein BASA81_011263 [Batrachochytrium salamandrivorans]|nr:hypothetical protein BASA81_011263 [Batrachochytrium salamandrivorans]
MNTLDLTQPLSLNPVWADVSPVPLSDESTTAFTDTMNYFRAVVLSDERSLRVFHLTKRVIMLNAANYTAWHLRREILFHTLGREEGQSELLDDELAFSKQFAEDFPKNYQIWSHRRKLWDYLVSSSSVELGHELWDRELEFVSQIFLLTDDDKNYHAWAHRQYVWGKRASEVEVEEEVKFCEQVLDADVRNNSAWNHRFLVLHDGGLLNFDTEFAFVKEKTKLAITNECGFNYLRAVCLKLGNGDLARRQVRLWLQDVVIESEAAYRSNPSARALLVDLLEQIHEFVQCAEQCTLLIQQHDTVRAAYWEWRLTRLSPQ